MTIDAKFTRSSFGGGWLWGFSPRLDDELADRFEEQPGPLGPLGGEIGFVIEPHEVRDMLEGLKADGFNVLVQE